MRRDCYMLCLSHFLRLFKYASSGVICTSLVLLFAMCLGCDTEYDCTGSYEESIYSGRHLDGDASAALVWNYGPTERYFRFHLRQFDNDIGGTFETFDLDSRELFTQIPTYMENPVSMYYCARIDYGYVRNHTAYVIFTDREQRQWALILDIAKDPPSGELRRANLNRVLNFFYDSEYYLSEDREYFEKVEQKTMPYGQIALERMDKDTERSLNCVYYYKNRKFDVILPNELIRLLNQTPENDGCDPDQANCENYKLAVIGMMPHHRIPGEDIVPFQEVMSARLDNCDLMTVGKRTIYLRENPFNILATNNSQPFFATLIAYKDVNRNNHWDSAYDPVLAVLDNQTLVFYDHLPGTMYGNGLGNAAYQVPVISEGQLDPSTGWFAFSDDSKEQSGIYRIIQNLIPQTADTLILKYINTSHSGASDSVGGCNLPPTEAQEPYCRGLVPILLQ